MSNHSKIETTDNINTPCANKSNVTGTTVDDKRALDVFIQGQKDGQVLDVNIVTDQTDAVDGETISYTGTATTTVSLVPGTAGKVINEIGLKRERSGNNNLEVSLDNGTTYFPLSKFDALTWDVKGGIRQVYLKTSSGSIDWEMLINFEET